MDLGRLREQVPQACTRALVLAARLCLWSKGAEATSWR